MDLPLSNTDLGKLERPLRKLIGVLSAGMGKLYEPIHVRRMAKASADAETIQAKNEIKVEQLLVRAAERQKQREARRQQNLESIAEKAQKYLPPEVSEKPVDPDWTFVFVDECQDTSDDELQGYWAKILASEVTDPGRCSRRTLKIVRTMERNDAEAFTKFCSFIFTSGTDLFALPLQYHAFQEFGLSSAHLRELDTLGLIAYSERTSIEIRVNGLIQYFGHSYVASEVRNDRASIPQIALTQRGRDLQRICASKPNPQYISALLNRLRVESGIIFGGAGANVGSVRWDFSPSNSAT